MTKVSRIALAVPFVLAAAAPATASNLFWDFSTSWTANSQTFTLRGTTQPGQSDTGTNYNVVSSLSFLINNIDQGFVAYSGGGFSIGGGTTFQPNYRPDPPVVNVQFSGPNSWTFQNNFTWTTAGWNPAGGTQAYTLTSNGSTFYFNGERLHTGNFFPSNRTEDGASSFSVTQTTTASVVPEINGSGFAYIAFILGALGLWLYSGPARGRPQETTAAA
jgi:hypothetical protein